MAALITTTTALLMSLSSHDHDGLRTEAIERPSRGPNTVEPKPMRQIFDVNYYDIDDIIQEKEHETGTKFVLDEDIIRVTTGDVIPELCYLTPDNITIYNSFLLDRNCLEELESVSPQCRGFKCQLVHYFLEQGARIYGEFFNAASIQDAMEVVNRELSAGFQELDICTCGKEFLKALLRCAPFCDANFLRTVFWNKRQLMRTRRAAMDVDFTSGTKFIDRLMAGICTKSGSGICLNSILNSLEEMAEMLETTIDEYEDYDNGNRKFQKSQEKRCDALFGSARAWNKDERDLDYFDGEQYWEVLVNKTAAVTKAFYCEKGCKKTRTAVYPCCMRKMLEDTKMFDNLERVIESIYKVIPVTDEYFLWYGYNRLQENSNSHSYSEEEIAEIVTWTLPKTIRDDFMRIVHGAKYCEGKIVRCSN